MRRRHHERDAGRELAGLYREHSASLFAYAYHLLGSREDAEDVVQVAFLQAHRALLRGEELVNPRAWLSVVVKRQAFNRWRDRRELPVEQLPEPAHEDRAQETAAKLARVRATLLSLPEAQHQAFVLRHWSGLSGREIAEVLGVTESAVESLLVRARSSILAAGPVADACVALRDSLARQGELSPVEHRHVAGCTGCRRAQQRLARVAAAAAVLALVPRAHVAQALAATVPGFAAASTTGAGGAAGAGAATKALSAKLAAIAVISAATVGATKHAVVLQHSPSPARHGTAPVPADGAAVSSRAGATSGGLKGSSTGDSQSGSGQEGTDGNGGGQGENGQEQRGGSGSGGDSPAQGDQGSGSGDGETFSQGGGPGPSSELSGADQSGGGQGSSSPTVRQGDSSAAPSGGD